MTTLMYLLSALATPLWFIGQIWIIVSAFMAGNVLWGVLSICGPLALVHGFQNYVKLKVPTIMMCVALGLSVIYGLMVVASR